MASNELHTFFFFLTIDFFFSTEKKKKNAKRCLSVNKKYTFLNSFLYKSGKTAKEYFDQLLGVCRVQQPKSYAPKTWSKYTTL